jgi:hypothetical protein
LLTLNLTVLPFILLNDFATYPTLPSLLERTFASKAVESTIILRSFRFCVISGMLDSVLMRSQFSLSRRSTKRIMTVNVTVGQFSDEFELILEGSVDIILVSLRYP